MYDFVIKLHIVVSSIFLLIAIVVLSWAIVGWIKNLKTTLAFNRLSFFFIHFLYIQLVTGVTLYFFLKPEVDSTLKTLEEAMDQNALRFWAIEHVSLMLFALILSQIGRLLIKQMSSDRKRFRAATFYFGISFIVVLISAAMAVFR